MEGRTGQRNRRTLENRDFSERIRPQESGARRHEVSPKGTGARFTIRMQKKLAVLFIVVLLAFLGLSMRLYAINKEDSENYKKQVLSQQEYSSKVLPYKRGDILDAKGTKLAYSEKVYNLVVDASIINSKQIYVEPTVSALNTCFGVDANELRNHLAEKPNDKYYVVKKQLTYEEISPFLELQNDKEKGTNIKGIWFEEEYKRMYPFGSIACHVLGFTSKDNIGTNGLEAYYSDTLNGSNGREYGYLNDDSELERTTKVAVDGKNIVTSLDVNIQKIVEKYIKQFNEEHKGEYREGELGSKHTAVIVMNPKTGNVLAMAAYPDYDLNYPRDISAYYTEQEIADMEAEDTYLETVQSLWRNYCIQDAFEPGSTAKAMTVAAGLDAGRLSGSEYYECNGQLIVSGHTIHCHKTGGHGSLNVSGALEQSCNVALMQMGDTIGIETFMKYLANFNIGLKTNIDLAGEARTANLIYSAEDMVRSDLAISTFGQGYKVTMIQLASAFCSIINGGYYYEPHLVTEIQNPDGSTSETIEPRVLKQVISTETSEKMRTYLNAVCITGTGTAAVPAGYTIGGKTGTAETYPRKQGQYVVSFIGYAPADDPQVVVYVVVDRPNVADQPHSTFAQEIAKGIFTEILPYMNIFRTEQLTEEEEEELRQLQILGSVSENSIEEEEEQESTEEEADKEDETEKPNYTYDEQTGNIIDPLTGYQVNPDTMEYVDPSFSAIGDITGTPSENEPEDAGEGYAE
ncbi:MAG: cell division protein FtsI [Lachnospiraceae bacterium]|nr:cell division protein FtsI [Lachnospiraceae bacterium]